MSADSDRPVSDKKPYTPPPPPPGKEVLVSVRGVDKIFTKGGETVYALNDINIDVYQAEYLSIMGPSGSGKSTLFNMIGALDKPSRGEISVGGVSLPKLASRELSYFRCKHIGYVFQSYNLIPWLTALGNVMLQARAASLVGDVWEMRRCIAETSTMQRFEPQSTVDWEAAFEKFVLISPALPQAFS